MAHRSPSELVAGFVVIAVAVGFLSYAVAHTGRTNVSGYSLNARFDRIDGLDSGADVRMAGVRIGNVMSERIDPKTYQAVVSFSVEPQIRLPDDSSAEITSDGLLGAKYLALVPGGSEKMLAEGGTVSITQSAISIEELLGKFIFSVTDLASSARKQLNPSDATAPK